MMQTTSIFDKNILAYQAGCRIIANKGGTRSGKTFSILQLLLLIAVRNSVLISVVSESMPHLKRGCVRDFENILRSLEWVEGREYELNKSNSIYTFPSGGKIEFFSADNAGKVHGSQRDYLFFNECNHVPYEIYRQLAIRTAKTIFLDWNPTAMFWYEERVKGKAGTEEIHSTYLDNQFLTASQIAEIESNKGDANWWKVYGLGETGSVEGLVYTDWELVDELPSVYKRDWYCIDFGFTNDPTAILHVILSGGELWVDELWYQSGTDNPTIAKILRNAGATRLSGIVCDSAEPKSIAEINSFGFNAVGSVKGRDSILSGIQILQRYKLHVTRRSLGVIQELRNFMWKRAIDGRWLNVPIDLYNHALDALRYGALTYLSTRRSGVIKGRVFIKN